MKLWRRILFLACGTFLIIPICDPLANAFFCIIGIIFVCVGLFAPAEQINDRED
jgi:hypothetical protein